MIQRLRCKLAWADSVDGTYWIVGGCLVRIAVRPAARQNCRRLEQANLPSLERNLVIASRAANRTWTVLVNTHTHCRQGPDPLLLPSRTRLGASPH